MPRCGMNSAASKPTKKEMRNPRGFAENGSMKELRSVKSTSIPKQWQRSSGKGETQREKMKGKKGDGKAGGGQEKTTRAE